MAKTADSNQSKEKNAQEPLNEKIKEEKINTNTDSNDNLEVQQPEEEGLLDDEQVDTNNEEASEEKPLAEIWIERVLNHSIRVLDNENKEVIKPVKEIINPETDIWFSKKKRKPILTDSGVNKLISATGAVFPKINPIEKQCDAPSQDREQVWIEATVVFPNDETNSDYGIANRMNCTDQISRANLPIMARKRARHRAFLRSEYIGLYDVYDENEMLDARDEKHNEEMKRLKQELEKTIKKNKKIINQLCKEIKTEEGELVWSINDPELLVNLSKGSSLTAYIAQLKLQHLNKKNK
ncbi:hypothetical protein [Bacillus cereus]|uniref:hypothetical protein n=1 Tax=Bacillus cereus TaxID=1396 RepID=UPI000B4AE8C1|nr:hypothetical protein [Bacillus cereus]